MIEQRLEQQIIAALREVAGAAPYYADAWGIAAAGDVKGDEPSDGGSVVSVTVSPRQMATYGGGVPEVEAEFPVAVACSISADADPTGAEMFGLVDVITAKIWEWVRAQTTGQETELTVIDEDGETVLFSPGGVMSTGGTAPQFVQAAHMWTWSIGFNVKGIITE